ncbi:Response regulator MprA [Poriferisphaera corsica]|uniref:Response regulator MprA n=1 Tax=Poriferisphaera corsica TaxID=2528020 RepID=A0A517YY33_9BACT|nr:winged helix-turn-helix domain-containing protein [Poriferisphaera corsica]QDU35143.1 Response regulator MprA [Poriferisphaera corsica]
MERSTEVSSINQGLPVKGEVTGRAEMGMITVLVSGEGYLQQLAMHHLDGVGVRVKHCSWDDLLENYEALRPTLVVMVVEMSSDDRLEIASRLNLLRGKDTETGSVVAVCREMTSDETISWLGWVDDILGGENVSNRRLFLARLQARLRPRGVHVRWDLEPAGQPHAGEDVCESFRVGEITMWPEKFEVRVSGKRVTLTLTQFRLLEMLLKRPGWILTPEVIRQTLNLESGEARDSVVKNHVYMLRRKLGVKAAKQIETVRGVGYRIREEYAAEEMPV